MLKIMHKFISLSIVGLLLNGCAAMNNNTQQFMNTGQTRSTSDGTIYENKPLGMSVPFPKDWVVLTGEQFKTRIEAGETPGVFISNHAKNACETSIICALKLKGAYPHRQFNTLFVQLMKQVPGDINQTRDSFKKIIDRDGKGKVTTDVLPSIEVNNHVFAHVLMNYNMPDHQMQMNVYLTNYKNFTILYMFLSVDDSDGQSNSEKIIKTIHFEKTPGDLP